MMGFSEKMKDSLGGDGARGVMTPARMAALCGNGQAGRRRRRPAAAKAAQAAREAAHAEAQGAQATPMPAAALPVG